MRFTLCLLCLLLSLGVVQGAELLSNGSLETLDGSLQPQGWDYHSANGALLNIDPAHARTGSHSLAFDLSLSDSPEWDHALFAVQPGRLCRLRCAWRTEQAASSGWLDVLVRWWASASRSDLVSQQAVIEHVGVKVETDWTSASRWVTVPAGAAYGEVMVYSAATGPQGLVYMDDFSFDDEAQVARVEEPSPWPTVFPKVATEPAVQLDVFDLRGQSMEVCLAVSTLQGLVNRTQPRIYAYNQLYDPQWLTLMQTQGIIDGYSTVTGWAALVEKYKSELAGQIIYDPAVPGSINAACMIGSVTGAVVLSPTLSSQVTLPVTLDLRGLWTRNVEAYQYVYDHYWDQMNHHMLASVQPLTAAQHVRDYLTAFKVFTFWISSPLDSLDGADPEAERALVDRLLAATPDSIPVWGWFSFGDPTQGISEYEAINWISRFGKFFPGTEFSSNLSVHSALDPADFSFEQTQRAQAPALTLDPAKVYVCLNLLDSGDAQWYWQFHQRQVWEDAARGQVPIGWSLNPTVRDTMPMILDWYYDQMTPSDELFCAQSGLGYMHTGRWGEAFTDGSEAWEHYLSLTSQYCASLDMQVIELYDGSWNEPTPPGFDVLAGYTRQMQGLRALLPDFGRHDATEPNKAVYLYDQVPVFHALTQFPPSFGTMTDEENIQYAAQQIIDSLPTERPGFMNTMMISWRMEPTQIRQVAQALPVDVQVVTVSQLLDLYEQHLSTRNAALNGDFATGDLSGWSYWARGGALGTAQVLSDGEGGQACLLTRASIGAFDQEDLVLISTNDPFFPNAQVRAGHSYVFSFEARAGDGQSVQAFHSSAILLGNPQPEDPSTEAGTGEEFARMSYAGAQWSPFELAFTVPATSSARRAQLQFRLATEALRGIAGQLWLRDIRLVETEPPVPAALTVLQID